MTRPMPSPPARPSMPNRFMILDAHHPPPACLGDVTARDTSHAAAGPFPPPVPHISYHWTAAGVRGAPRALEFWGLAASISQHPKGKPWLLH